MQQKLKHALQRTWYQVDAQERHPQNREKRMCWILGRTVRSSCPPFKRASCTLRKADICDALTALPLMMAILFSVLKSRPGCDAAFGLRNCTRVMCGMLAIPTPSAWRNIAWRQYFVIMLCEGRPSSTLRLRTSVRPTLRSPHLLLLPPNWTEHRTRGPVAEALLLLVLAYPPGGEKKHATCAQ
jgi:hypothetical protein